MRFETEIRKLRRKEPGLAQAIERAKNAHYRATLGCLSRAGGPTRYFGCRERGQDVESKTL